MFSKLIERGINAELIVTLLFIILSGLYIIWTYGFAKILDVLFLWMFPASVILFLSLFLVKMIERYHDKKVKTYKYVDWRKK